VIERLSDSFETARLTIRRVAQCDLDGLMAVNTDAEVTRFLPYPAWQSFDDAEAWLGRIVALEESGSLRQFVIVERSEARVVGVAVVFRFDASNRRAELGYALGKRDWGRGLMREALVGLLSSLFDDLELNRVEAVVDPRNGASHRLLIGLGFHHEGLLRERSVMKGEVVDSNAYGLLARDFRALAFGPRPSPG
jgi:[ribosomal protein S5]-alanine N-acetyltransferase